MQTYKGKFKPKNPQKYNGDPTNIIYRSLWERKCMVKFDENPNVLEWRSEEIAIPYISPIDNKIHRYFPDFLIKVVTKEGSKKTYLIEVKPKSQTKEPKKKKRITQAYLREVTEWGKNSAKWKAAENYCFDRGWEFKILTEDEIFGKNR